jgi:hypothetical protein
MSIQPRNSRAPLDAFLKASDPPPEFAGHLKYEFDKHLFYYGAQFTNGYDRAAAGRDLAIALGDCFIEKHFTLKRATPGPDNVFSLEPREFKATVAAVRTTGRPSAVCATNCR